jgi:hypothetical protein
VEGVDIEVTRTEIGEVLIDTRVLTDGLIMSLARLYVQRREEMHELFADLVVLEGVESRGMHAQENTVEAILNNLYAMTGTNPYVPLNREDINRLRRALDDPDKPKPRAAFANAPAAMMQARALGTLADQANASEQTGETPIHDAMQADHG